MSRGVHQVNGLTVIEEELNNLFLPEWLREILRKQDSL
jgi:hypothetical protein